MRLTIDQRYPHLRDRVGLCISERLCMADPEERKKIDIQKKERKINIQKKEGPRVYGLLYERK